jgi:hypothetical protein
MKLEGVVLAIIAGESAKVAALLGTRIGYYIYFAPADKPISFDNLAGPDVDLGIREGDHIVIQSGGKMWCGYENFVELVRELAHSLEDSLFYVGDQEVCYVDEFRIQNRCLQYRRVHQGTYLPVEMFLESHGIT